MAKQCSECGLEPLTASARFCAICGTALPDGTQATRGTKGNRNVVVGSLYVDPPIEEEPRTQSYLPSAIRVFRLLAFLCMLSAFMAAIEFDTRTAPGRVLIATSITVSVAGQFAALLGSRPFPPRGTSALLLLFFLGLIILPFLWLILLPYAQD
jgi:hypothetical protein